MTNPLNTIIDLPDKIRAIAEEDPNRAALIHIKSTPWGSTKNEITTFKELSDRAERLAVGLREYGIERGTLCSFMVPPGEDALVLSLALWRIGAIMVGVEPHSHGLTKIDACLRRVGPDVFFGTPEAFLAQRVFGWGKDSITRKILVGPKSAPGFTTLRSLERPVPQTPEKLDVKPTDIAVIAFTTGSTGTPKPTVMTQRNLSQVIAGVQAQWQLDSHGDILDMPTFPIFWIIGLAHGGTVVVPPMNFATKGPGDANPGKLVKVINDNGVKSMFASPALLVNLTNYCNPRGITLPSFKRIVSGGAEIQGPLYEAVKKMIPNGELYSNYGATEALPVAEIDGTTVVNETWPQSETGRGVCVGNALAGVEVKIVEITDGPIDSLESVSECGPNEVGEVIVRGPHVSDHYYQSEKDMLENKILGEELHWHRLGDTGFLDESNRLWVCGRVSHRVVTTDKTYFALQCEPIFNTIQHVHRSALIALTQADGSKKPAMCIELVPGSHESKDALRAKLKDVASQFEATSGIEDFVFIKKLPVDRRHNAKIDRPALSRQASAGTIH